MLICLLVLRHIEASRPTMSEDDVGRQTGGRFSLFAAGRGRGTHSHSHMQAQVQAQAHVSPIHSGISEGSVSTESRPSTSSYRVGGRKVARARAGLTKVNRLPDSDDEEDYRRSSRSSRVTAVNKADRTKRTGRDSTGQPGINAEKFASEAAFKDVLLLNVASDDYSASLSDNAAFIPGPEGFLPVSSLGPICAELRRLLGECIMLERSSCISGTGGAGDFSLARDAPVYRDVVNISSLLGRLDLTTLLGSNGMEKKQFVQLHTLMCMHASVALNTDVREVTDSYSRVVAYKLGARVFTAHEVNKLCGDDSAFRDSMCVGSGHSVSHAVSGKCSSVQI
jgi:hypothetical protein